jgi:hypothetical protein
MTVCIKNEECYWRNRAEETRVLSESIEDEWSKSTLLRMALDYVSLAERAGRFTRWADVQPLRKVD